MPQPLPPELLDEILLLSLECHPSISLTLLPLSKHIHTFLLPHLYTHISLSSPHALQSLVQTLRSNPQSARHVRYFYLRGPQGRKEKDEEERGKAEYRDGWDERLEELEPGIEGEGEIATFDEHESLMTGASSILELCSSSLRAFGFLECIPWFSAPELHLPYIALPKMEQFTGATYGTFGLLPHLVTPPPALQRSRPELARHPTRFKRVHLLGGDFGSFVCARSLPSSSSSSSLTHFAITAPTHYKPEHRSRLVAHIVAFVKSMPKLRVVSVAFPVYRASRAAAAAAAAGGPIATQAGDGDGDGNGNGNGNANDAEANDDEDEHSTRSKASRSAYLSAFPLALESAGKTGVQARILDLHFGRPSGGGEGEGGEEGAERRGGTRTNFAECILDRRQHFRGCRIEDEDADEGEDEDEEAYACRPEIPHQEGYDSPSERYADVDASANPNADPYEDHVLGNDLDGMEMPVSSFWDVRPSFVWTLVGERAVRLRA